MKLLEFTLLETNAKITLPNTSIIAIIDNGKTTKIIVPGGFEYVVTNKYDQVKTMIKSNN